MALRLIIEDNDGDGVYYFNPVPVGTTVDDEDILEIVELCGQEGVDYKTEVCDYEGLSQDIH